MKHNKLTYEAPVITSLCVCAEGVLCGSTFGVNEKVVDTTSDVYNSWDWTF